MLRTVLLLALAALAFFALSTALLWWRQERIVFQPPGAVPAVGGGAERVEYRAADGQALFGYLVGPAPGAGVLIAFHGNADLAAWQVPWAEGVAARTGWRVLLAEYRGYGGLGGSPTYEGSRLDADAAYRYARETLGAPPERVALFGHSLGSAVAAELAARAPVRALLLQSPFTSARDMARFIVPRSAHALWRLISRVHYDTRARAAALDVPISVAHGDRDGIVPLWMGRAVHEAARRKGDLLVVPGAGHNDVAEAGRAEYWQWMERAVRR